MSATNAAFGAQATLARSGAADWSLGDGYVFHAGITLDSDTIDGGGGNDHIYGDMAVILPQLAAAGIGTVATFNAYPSSELGGTPEANYNYVYGFGPFGSLHPWGAPTATSPFGVDADTIRGGDGNDVLFGEIGNDNVDGGAGDDQVSGGFGNNIVSGGTGTNQVAFDRSRDTHLSGGGNDIARSTLDLTAGSPILPISWQSAVGSNVGHGMLNPITGPLSWTGTLPVGVIVNSVLQSAVSGNLNAWWTITLTLNMSEAVTVAGGIPTLTLNDGGTATYTGGSGTKMLTFSYTVAAGQKTGNLKVIAVNLGSAKITNAAGSPADLAGAIADAVTDYDASNGTPWSSQVAVLSGLGTLVSRTIDNDNGRVWTNVFDVSGTASWAWLTNDRDGQGNLVEQYGTNDDGTHWLTLYDVANAYSWSSVTWTFDANWAGTSLGGTLDNGTHTNAPVGAGAALDVALWFDTPYDANWSTGSHYSVPTGGSVELSGGFGSSNDKVTFVGTGTLKLDQSTAFAGQLVGFTGADVLDLTDITFGSGTTAKFTASGIGGGTLTVSDGTHTAKIALVGDYSLSTFTASSDGHGGTFVVDPPLHPASTPQPASVSVVPADVVAAPRPTVASSSAVAPTEFATVASVTTATILPSHASIGSAAGESASVAQPVRSAGPASPEFGSIVGNSTLPGESTLAIPAIADRASLPTMDAPQTAIVREIVSPDDLIRAIRKGDIAFKIEAPAVKPAAGSPWLFNEAHGTFEAPPAERFMIVVDSDEDGDDARVRPANPPPCRCSPVRLCPIGPGLTPFDWHGHGR